LASPRVTTGRVTCVMSGPKARVSSQFASHAHCGHRSPSWLFLFCGVRPCRQCADLGIGIRESAYGDLINGT
jgi:hypothetical protein